MSFSVSKTVKQGEKVIDVHTPQFVPTYVKYNNNRDFEVIPMHQLTEEDLANATKHYQEIKDHMSRWLPELEFLEKY
ncbi:poly-gamma-glutamate synthesis protein (capsule biosynthesis protein) [Oceanobacillus limi]|uniref:Poly-gamma-glutamate synthesis protein (Capsule biosynthesis protein) n=1 Tax=Oceanobacillus limi TaxID=930131 RepID=A0A1I0ARL1_9BACI|nr:hypothetical protein [Oceanobacillus limi]SES96983.1 poly-gamma-glutamate synthesis protein (capsule biosynthesis protein) [Oceanobacillus limi]